MASISNQLKIIQHAAWFVMDWKTLQDISHKTQSSRYIVLWILSLENYSVGSGMPLPSIDK